MFDLIIIGGGPAGLSAAIYAVRKNLTVLVLAKEIGGQAAISGRIENYLGFTVISGVELVMRFREDVERFKEGVLPAGYLGIWLKEGVEVAKVEGQEFNFTVTLTVGTVYQGKTILIASGRIPRMLNIPGEKEFLGKGVSTCATCDAPLFAGKDVAVVGGGNSVLDAAFTLQKGAKSVTIVNINETLTGDQILLKNTLQSPRVKVLNKHQVLEIMGHQFVTGLRIKDLLNGQQQLLDVGGVFIEIGWTPATQFDNLTQKNQKGEIMVDEYGESSVKGIWAAGDVNDLWGGQIIIAAGEGAKAALSISGYLSKQVKGG